MPVVGIRCCLPISVNIDATPDTVCLIPYIHDFMDDMQRVIGEAVELGLRERAAFPWKE